MPFVATRPERYKGRVVGDGHCVVYVQTCTIIPHTSAWRRGDPVRGSSCAPDTAIATFGSTGKYENKMDGSSHAAIYISQNDEGIRVWDQWVGQPVHERLIRFRGKTDKAVNDGDAYHVIELAT
jgi:hypothetical protein